MNKIKLISILLTVTVLYYSCNSERDKTVSDKQSGMENDDTISVLKETDASLTDLENVVYIRSNSIVFFSLSDKEFNQFIHRTGEQSEWDFELIYKQFKKMASNTKKALENKKVHAIYTVHPKIAFVTITGDTLYFNRKENDLFVGQIFFNGKDTLDVEEGLMRKDSLENHIKRYFNLKDDIDIKQTIISVVNNTGIKEDINIKQTDVPSVNEIVAKKDTVEKAVPDTLNIP